MGCAGVMIAPVFNGRDNPIKVKLWRDGGQLVDLSGVTRVTVSINTPVVTVIDSDTAGPGVITWTDQVLSRGDLVDVLTLVLGHQGIATGSWSCEIVLFDATYPNGLQLENALDIEVQD